MFLLITAKATRILCNFFFSSFYPNVFRVVIIFLNWSHFHKLSLRFHQARWAFVSYIVSCDRVIFWEGTISSNIENVHLCQEGVKKNVRCEFCSSYSYCQPGARGKKYYYLKNKNKNSNSNFCYCLPLCLFFSGQINITALSQHFSVVYFSERKVKFTLYWWVKWSFSETKMCVFLCGGVLNCFHRC